MKDSATGVLGFVAQVVASLAWPVTVLTCVLLLRRHLAKLIPLIRTVKYSDVEVRFGQEVEALAKSIDLGSVPTPSSPAEKNKWDELRRMAQVLPRPAIRMAFRVVEDSLLETARARHVDIADGAMGMPMAIGGILLNSGVISNDEWELLTRLRALLNEAEQAPPDSITSESAGYFINLAIRLAKGVAA
jgi:hypothetical protein